MPVAQQVRYSPEKYAALMEKPEEKQSAVVEPKENQSEVVLTPKFTLEPEDDAAHLTRGLWTEARGHGVSSSWRCFR